MIKWYWLVIVGVGGIALTILVFKLMLEQSITELFWVIVGKDKRRKP